MLDNTATAVRPAPTWYRDFEERQAQRREMDRLHAAYIEAGAAADHLHELWSEAYADGDFARAEVLRLQERGHNERAEAAWSEYMEATYRRF